MFLQTFIHETLSRSPQSPKFVFSGHKTSRFSSYSRQSWRKYNPLFWCLPRIYPDPSVQIIAVCSKDLKSKIGTCMSLQLQYTANIWQSHEALVIHCHCFVCAWSHTYPAFNCDHSRQAGWIPLHLLNYRSWCLVMFVHYWERRLREGKTKRKIVLIVFRLESDAFDPMHALIHSEGPCHRSWQLRVKHTDGTDVPFCLFGPLLSPSVLLSP